MDINKHRFMMMRILKDVFSDSQLSSILAFKGGTSLMFLYGLLRFSTDLDFNLLDRTKEQFAFSRMQAILTKYGKIADANIKFFGPIAVLDYGVGERKLKIEISNREYGNHYERKNFNGINIPVMTKEDMFAHKLCALLDRKDITGRDVFDCHFFLSKNTEINKDIVEYRMEKPLVNYIQDCIDALHKLSDKTIMSDMGELLDDKGKTFVRTAMRNETISLLEIFKSFPLIAQYEDSKMNVEDVSVFKKKTGMHAIRATIDGKTYLGKELSKGDTQSYLEQKGKKEQTTFASILAKKYFIKEWSSDMKNKNNIQR